MGFVVEKVALVQVFSEHFGFPCQFSLHPLLHIHHRRSSLAGTTGILVADVLSGLNLAPPQETKKRLNSSRYPLGMKLVVLGVVKGPVQGIEPRILVGSACGLVPVPSEFFFGRLYLPSSVVLIKVPVQGIEPRILGGPARGLVPVLSELLSGRLYLSAFVVLIREIGFMDHIRVLLCMCEHVLLPNGP
jgi:hypothetical protein